MGLAGVARGGAVPSVVVLFEKFLGQLAEPDVVGFGCSGPDCTRMVDVDRAVRVWARARARGTRRSRCEVGRNWKLFLGFAQVYRCAEFE